MNAESGSGMARDLEWLADTFRITVLSPSAEVDVSEAWAHVIGENPDTVMRKGVDHRAEGTHEDRLVRLASKPGRLDWTVSKPPPDEAPEDPLTQMLGRFAEELAVVTDIGKRWMDSASCPAAQRLALGAVLFAPVGSREEGYERLQAYLPYVEIDPAGSRDFQYQVNRPRITDTLGDRLVINRLCKWSVALVQTAVIVISPKALDKTPVNRPHPRKTACRLELDINTDKDFSGELTPDQMAALLPELASQAIEVSAEGDRP